jgi:hypothetical protein
MGSNRSDWDEEAPLSPRHAWMLKLEFIVLLAVMTITVIIGFMSLAGML